MKNISSFKNEKVSKKLFSQSMLISIFSILMCFVFLCSMTYAWFTASESSSENVIKSGFFALDIGVLDENGDVVPVVDNTDGTHTCTFTNAGTHTYTVTLKMTGDTTASKGYCELSISSVAENMQTEPISKDPDIGVEEFTFKIVAEANTVVVFEPKWGISASPDISNGGILAPSGEPENP